MLWDRVFAAGGWRTHPADTVIDALAVAFNAEADLVVTCLADAAGRNVGRDLVRELSRDEMLSEVPCALLVPEGVHLPDIATPHVTLFEQPCDPYWVLVHADARAGRATPRGLGHLVTAHGRGSPDEIDGTLHAWLWTLAAADLARQARRHPDRSTLLDSIGQRLARRVGADVVSSAERPDGADLATSQPDREDQLGWVVQIGSAGWWRITLQEEPLNGCHVECIAAVAGAVGDQARPPR